MPAVPCAIHPKELTVVRCARCEKPICTRCMVDTPVGKKCRECVRPKHHLAESEPKYVLLAFAVAVAVAIPAAMAMQWLPILILPGVIFGYVVGEAALWAGKRRRGLTMQVAAGAAALLGGLLGVGIEFGPNVDELGRAVGQTLRFVWRFHLFTLVHIGIGVASAVGRVRFW